MIIYILFFVLIVNIYPLIYFNYLNDLFILNEKICNNKYLPECSTYRYNSYRFFYNNIYNNFTSLYNIYLYSSYFVILLFIIINIILFENIINFNMNSYIFLFIGLIYLFISYNIFSNLNTLKNIENNKNSLNIYHKLYKQYNELCLIKLNNEPNNNIDNKYYDYQYVNDYKPRFYDKDDNYEFKSGDLILIYNKEPSSIIKEICLYDYTNKKIIFSNDNVFNQLIDNKNPIFKDQKDYNKYNIIILSNYNNFYTKDYKGHPTYNYYDKEKNILVSNNKIYFINNIYKLYYQYNRNDSKLGTLDILDTSKKINNYIHIIKKGDNYYISKSYYNKEKNDITNQFLSYTIEPSISLQDIDDKDELTIYTIEYSQDNLDITDENNKIIYKPNKNISKDDFDKLLYKMILKYKDEGNDGEINSIIDNEKKNLDFLKYFIINKTYINNIIFNIKSSDIKNDYNIFINDYLNLNNFKFYINKLISDDELNKIKTDNITIKNKTNSIIEYDDNKPYIKLETLYYFFNNNNKLKIIEDSNLSLESIEIINKIYTGLLKNTKYLNTEEGFKFIKEKYEYYLLKDRISPDCKKNFNNITKYNIYIFIIFIYISFIVLQSLNLFINNDGYAKLLVAFIIIVLIFLGFYFDYNRYKINKNG